MSNKWMSKQEMDALSRKILDDVIFGRVSAATDIVGTALRILERDSFNMGIEKAVEVVTRHLDKHGNSALTELVTTALKEHIESGWYKLQKAKEKDNEA